MPQGDWVVPQTGSGSFAPARAFGVVAPRRYVAVRARPEAERDTIADRYRPPDSRPSLPPPARPRRLELQLRRDLAEPVAVDRTVRRPRQPERRRRATRHRRRRRGRRRGGPLWNRPDHFVVDVSLSRLRLRHRPNRHEQAESPRHPPTTPRLEWHHCLPPLTPCVVRAWTPPAR